MTALSHLAPSARLRTAREIVRDLATENGVRYRRSGLDDWAEGVSRLAGDDVSLDRTEELIVALRQAGVITGAERTALHAQYLLERDV